MSITSKEFHQRFAKRGNSFRTKKERGPESILQQWCVEYFRETYPHLEDLCFSVPNGVIDEEFLGYTGMKRFEVGSRMKDEGVKKGVSDILILVARGGWNGVAIEFKIKSNLSPEQLDWGVSAMQSGYLYQVIRTRHAFVNFLNSYFLLR